MRSRFTRLLAVLAVVGSLAGLIAGAGISSEVAAPAPSQPAAASPAPEAQLNGVGYYSTTNCTSYNGWPWARLDIAWNQTGTGIINYWLDGWSNYYGVHPVYDEPGTYGPKWLTYYAAGGFQCNWPGAPKLGPVQCSGFLPLPYEAQLFEGGVFVSDYNGNIRNKTWAQGANPDPCHSSNW